ncbi:NADH:flavin oxidoreductase/NADH oxidase [Rhodocyclus tenuis]|uniref:2,4-dienoyl-CoA reductase-like NADH-dependent reductase (Old Yellow Enzyme family) n=1 Tax=Rhodocyclus tenuis TaxID=1066 RepID=A0A840GDM7_RHOTE|nr:NADH:flavin oxidoreductase/NADH oxidase [Rhodocyclus tenuis]MBB4246339.1 2,4-dienoyl-CoA reductase-like NADH-dependent reductase (Old Yellow Enzyme family) [Rhodocyclus tenuis]
MTSPLFSPLALRELTLPNRIVIAPMCMYSAVDGKVGDFHTMHVGTLAQSGAGLFILEATAVTPEGRITPLCPGLWDDACAAAWAPVLAAARQHSQMPLAIQLAHAGRKASCAAPWLSRGQLAPDAGGWQTLAPSPLPFEVGESAPQALDAGGLARIRDAFAAAARRADRLGIDAVEIHAAHGYLLHQFLSPLANQRSDAYGGSLENRLRFPLEVFDAVRAVWPAGKPLGLRVSATDWVDGGWEIEQTLVLAQALQARGCDFLHVSSGGLSPAQQIVPAPGYQLPFARRVKAETGLTTIGVGLITEPQQAEAAIADGDADLVALARGILWNPRWPWHAAAALGAQIAAPPQYWRGAPAEAGHVFRR